MVMGALERLNPPRVLGDLTLLAALGEGGMATVYLAGVGSGPLARMCAVKLLRANLPDHDYRTRFLDEARLVVRLHHNNLVDVRAAGEIDEQLYIAMEAIEGRDLADVWDRCAEVGRAFPVPLAVHVCREVLRGLHYAHTFPGLGLVHRDVSPSNILIDWAGAVRLADFGLATSSLKASLTLPGVVFGKVGYMSPEQARHEPLDGRADVYAVAVILWELLTGRPLRAAEGVSTDTVSRFEAVAPSSKSRRVDATLDQIVIKGLARNREDRWETAQAMMLALNQWIADHAPDMGQELVADFMRTLFGNAREVESGDRVGLLRELTGGFPAASPSGPAGVSASPGTDATQLEPAPPVEPQTTRSETNTPGIDSKELLAPGVVIADRYRVLSRLGRGGMGYVYLGEHLTVGRSVAIKVLTFEWSRTAAVAQRFRAEARAASAAGHPNIVEVFDAGELADGRLYLVMEFLTGRNLFEEVQTVGPLPIARACHIMRDVGRAIRAAHEVGIIHRDLKPDNVMLVDRGRDEGEVVKVLDFGISSSAQRPDNTERLTTVGQALGTPEYMAPEQAKGFESDERFDIYAIGVMFFELLTGDPPFHGSNVFEIVTRKTSELAPSVATKRSNLPADLIKLVDDCLSLDPKGRPQTAQLFLARVEDVLRKLPRDGARTLDDFDEETRPTPVIGAKPKPTPEPVVRPALTKREDPMPRGRAPIYVVLAVGAVVAVLLGVWGSNWLKQRRAEPTVKVAAIETPSETLPPPADLPVELETPTATTVVLDTTDSETETGTEETGTEPTSDDTGSDTAGPTIDPVVPPHKTEACRKTREAAQAAAVLWHWDEVLKLTKSNRSCWASKSERVRIEVQANMESGRYKDCVRVGAGAKGEVEGWVTTCRSKL